MRDKPDSLILLLLFWTGIGIIGATEQCGPGLVFSTPGSSGSPGDTIEIDWKYWEQPEWEERGNVWSWQATLNFNGDVFTVPECEGSGGGSCSWLADWVCESALCACNSNTAGQLSVGLICPSEPIDPQATMQALTSFDFKIDESAEPGIYNTTWSGMSASDEYAYPLTPVLASPNPIVVLE